MASQLTQRQNNIPINFVMLTNLNHNLVMSKQTTPDTCAPALLLPPTRLLFAGLAAVLMTATAYCEQMPQDNWHYDQKQFAGPDPNQPIDSIAIGSGGVYVGRGYPATAIWQFQENGVYLREYDNFAAIIGIACDSAGNVYVLDATNSTLSVNVFERNGNSLRQWGSAGANDGQFGPFVGVNQFFTALAIDGNDQIYVCDPGNTRVQVFDTQGNFLRKWGVAGVLPGQFATNGVNGLVYPNAIAANPNGQIYVNAPQRDLSIQVFTSNGSYITSLYDNYSINGTAIAISADGLVSLGDNYTWAGYGGHRVYDMNFNELANLQDDRGYFSAVAFNKRGDLFCAGYTQSNVNGTWVYAHHVMVYQREYSSVQNPPTPPAIPEPMVLASAQRTNTAWLDVDYQVTHADGSNVTTAALAFINGGNTLSSAVPMSTFMENTATNLGPNVPSNIKRRFTWNMGADWSIDYAQIQVEVLAKDNRNLMGFHWITVPSDGTNPAIQISSGPVPESELLSIWFWFVATHNPGIAFASGNVTGLGGAYDGQLLASDAGTTLAGRSFAYSQMGVRRITQPEIDRANAGRYGFSSVDVNSVVKLP